MDRCKIVSDKMHALTVKYFFKKFEWDNAEAEKEYARLSRLRLRLVVRS